ncbi:co-chaperone GroES [Candidatus Dojkabacteria bacterium]|jgi:chaperonin GroES|nr:co-chaperone GroES [Candidatus Dojkabacteria bacterium]
MSEVKITPIGKRILVKPEEIEVKTKAGLYIPPTANEEKKPESGKVVKLGTADKDKFAMKIGDRVFFKKYSPEEITVDGEKYLILEISDVIAIIK